MGGSPTTPAATGTARVPGRGGTDMVILVEREADLLPVGYLHVVFTLPAEVADIGFQKTGGSAKLGKIQTALLGSIELASTPKTPRRAHRHHRGAPHLGIGDDAPSAHDRAGRRRRAGRKPLDIFSVGLPASGARTRQAVPTALPHPAGRAAQRRTARLLGIDGAPVRAAAIRAAPVAGPQEALGGVRQGAVRRAGGGARL